ncbi:MAG: helix-turn-helix domain-containing protein [Actinobacteria bacterium]|nr:helix-turn-helix domain-containing protein [Actinomycetota bacterium]
MAKDFLDEIIAESTARNPEFPKLLERAQERRERLRQLALLRGQLGLSQTEVAARMGTSQPVVARIESGTVDVKLSTLEKYAAALNRELVWNIA